MSYRLIAAEIHSRIARGELRPGDRVPSTRQITQEWGVAMATATKVLSALRDAGVVDTRPGVGTIVRSTPAEAARPGAPRERELSRDRVVSAAIAIADAEGLAMLSMRRVAALLGVPTMSLYRHVPSKDELTLAMTDAVFADQPFRRPRPAGWRPRLETAARLLWTVLRTHPWAAEILSMTRPQVIPNVLEYAEWNFSTLRELGFDMADMMYTHLTLFSHARGLALCIQPEVQAQRDTGLTTREWMETQEADVTAQFADGRFPTFQWAMTQQFEYDLDAVFEYGLRRLLDGIAVRPARPGTADGPAGPVTG